MNNKYILLIISILVFSAVGLIPFANAQTTNPLPTITNISPLNASAGSSSVTVTINGTNFVSNSIVNFNGVAKQTTYISPFQLSFVIPQSELVAGTYGINVFNTSPGGGTSNSQIFTVTGGSLMPTITTISPSSKLLGGTDFVITVNGSNFNAASIVSFNGVQKTTTYVSANQLTANIPALDIVNAGTYLISVFDPVRGSSNSVAFNVTSTPPIPNTGFGPISGSGATNDSKTVLSFILISIVLVFAAAVTIKVLKVVSVKSK